MLLLTRWRMGARIYTTDESVGSVIAELQPVYTFVGKSHKRQ